MKKQLFINYLLVAIFMMANVSFGFSQNKDLKNIRILATGGTIAGTGVSATGSAYTSGKVTIDAMIDAVPNIRKLANLEGEQTSNVDSQDMSV